MEPGALLEISAICVNENLLIMPIVVQSDVWGYRHSLSQHWMNIQE